VLVVKECGTTSNVYRRRHEKSKKYRDGEGHFDCSGVLDGNADSTSFAPSLLSAPAGPAKLQGNAIVLGSPGNDAASRVALTPCRRVRKTTSNPALEIKSWQYLRQS